MLRLKNRAWNELILEKHYIYNWSPIRSTLEIKAPMRFACALVRILLIFEVPRHFLESYSRVASA